MRRGLGYGIPWPPEFVCGTMTLEGTVVTGTPFPPSRLAALALCVAAFVNLAAPSLLQAGVVVCGDVNGDGVTNIGDAPYSLTCT